MRKNDLDQFYTKENIAKKLFECLNNHYKIENYFLFEPSAGTGSFCRLFHSNSLAIDCEPKSNLIIKKDFFDINEKSFKTNLPILTIGNPPFGKNSSLALKFLNKSGIFSEVVAFVLPKTFKKKEYQNKILKNLHLVFEEDLPKHSFEHNSKNYDVPCVFQIWEKREEERNVFLLKKESDLFDFVSKEQADFAIRRVGVYAGKIYSKYENYKPSSHYYIRLNNTLNKLEFIELFNSLFNKFQKVAHNTAGNPSLSKGEMIEILEKEYCFKNG